MKTDFNSENLKSYLLGNIPNDLAERIDLEVISNKEVEETLIVAEETLIEDYLDDTLNLEEKELFHKNFLTNEERKSQLLIISQLKNYAKVNNFEATDNNEEEIELNFFQRLNLVFANPLFSSLFIIVFLGFIGGLIWFGYSSNSNNLSQLESEFATLNKSDFTNEADYKENSKLDLISGTSRGKSETKEFQKELLTKNVLFNLVILTDLKSPELFKVELYKGNELVFTQPEINIIKVKSAGVLRFLLPSKILDKGQYQIKAQSNRNSDNKLTYSFLVK